jgi:hypothetical protein
MTPKATCAGVIGATLDAMWQYSAHGSPTTGEQCGQTRDDYEPLRVGSLATADQGFENRCIGLYFAKTRLWTGYCTAKESTTVALHLCAPQTFVSIL